MALFRRSSPPSEAPEDADDSETEAADEETTERDEALADEGDEPEEGGAPDDEELEDEEDEHHEDEAGPARPPILPRLAAVGHRVRLWRWWTPTLLILIFLLALFLRSYFYWPEAT